MIFVSRQPGWCGHPTSQKRQTVPCITTAIFLQSRKALLAHLSLSVVHMRRAEWSICLNLHILSTVWSLGVPDSASYRHTSPSQRTGSWVCHPSCSLHLSITAIHSSEGSHIQRKAHTNSQAPGLNWIKKTQGQAELLFRRALLDIHVFIQTSPSTLNKDPFIHTHISPITQQNIKFYDNSVLEL